MTLPRASTDAAARVPLCESIPIATSTLASFRRPTYDGGWRRTSRRRGRPSLLSSHFRRPGSGRRDDQVKGQRHSRGPRLAVSESPPAGSGHSRPKAGPTGGFHTPAVSLPVPSGHSRSFPVNSRPPRGPARSALLTILSNLTRDL